MNTKLLCGRILVAGVVLLFVSAGIVPAQRAETENPDAIETQSRGPVHEAFAEPVVLDPQPGMIVSGEPPTPIKEASPDLGLEDPNLIWISGYWGWDEDRNDFLWISGIWRIPPPGYSWVPGYWTRVENGYQWVAGFWTSMASRQISYLPIPPQTLEVGPSGTSPSTDVIWAPGVWCWRETRYVWRPGHWIPARLGWVWVPARYVWTPRGAIFVDGHWDYTLDHRGVLFAPVYVPRTVYIRRTFSFTPTVVISTDALSVHLFTRLRYDHYYFGDYYAPEYERRGIYPWFELHRARSGYDPIYTYQQWQHGRTNLRWSEELCTEYRRRVEHVELRPLRTYTQQVLQGRTIEGLGERERRTIAIARPLKDLVRSKDLNFKFQTVTPESRRQIVKQENDLRRFTDERSGGEGQRNRSNVVARKPNQSQPQAISNPNVVIQPRSAQSDTRIRIAVPPKPQAVKPLPADRPQAQSAQNRSINPEIKTTVFERPSNSSRPQTGIKHSDTGQSTLIRPSVEQPQARPIVPRVQSEPSRSGNRERVFTPQRLEVQRQNGIGQSRPRPSPEAELARSPITPYATRQSDTPNRRIIVDRPSRSNLAGGPRSPIIAPPGKDPERTKVTVKPSVSSVTSVSGKPSNNLGRETLRKPSDTTRPNFLTVKPSSQRPSTLSERPRGQEFPEKNTKNKGGDKEKSKDRSRK